MGAGLYFHNLFHNKDYKQSATTVPDNKSVQLACNCIDDFTTPFTETEIIDLPGITPLFADHTSFYKESTSYSFHLFNSLRAPPVA